MKEANDAASRQTRVSEKRFSICKEIDEYFNLKRLSKRDDFTLSKKLDEHKEQLHIFVDISLEDLKGPINLKEYDQV